MAKRDYYEVLGIEKTADDAAIKSAYRKLAKKYHPDLNPGDKEAEEHFKEINEAYQTLSDPQKRAQYDQFGPEGPQGFGGGAGYGGFSGFGGAGGFDDLGDVFSSFFGGGFGGGFGGYGQKANGPVRGDDIRYDLNLSFEEAALGCEKGINITTDEVCPNCHGTGANAGSNVETCPNCKGSGQERVITNTILGRMQTTRTCSKCGGKGKIIKDPCPKCKGRGKVTVSKRRTVKIPAGVDTGIILTDRGSGAAGENGGPNGDLQIVLHVRPHKLFKREEDNLFIDLPLTITQAALGTEIDIPTLTKPVKYRFPEGTQPGQVFCIRGEGVKHVRGGGYGDLYVTTVVEIPKKLSEKQKNLLREFDGTTSDKQYEKKKSFFDRLKDAFS